MSSPLIPVGMHWHSFKVSVLQVETVWWPVSMLYEHCGATSPTQKRTIRRHLEHLHPAGAYQDKRGWHVAEIVARTYFAQYHDDAIRRAAGGQLADIRRFRPRSIAQTA